MASIKNDFKRIYEAYTQKTSQPINEDVPSAPATPQTTSTPGADPLTEFTAHLNSLAASLTKLSSDPRKSALALQQLQKTLSGIKAPNAPTTAPATPPSTANYLPQQNQQSKPQNQPQQQDNEEECDEECQKAKKLKKDQENKAKRSV